MIREKKILVISHNSFSKVANNGKTLESLFSAHSKENLAQVFFSQNEVPDFDFCDQYFKITDTAVLKSLFSGYSEYGEILSNKKFVNLTNLNTSNVFNNAKLYSDKLIVFRDLLWSFNSWKSKLFLQWIENFNPDIIFYVGGNFSFSHSIARFISKRFGIPLIVYFTDDYLIYPKFKNFFDIIQRFRMKNFYRKTVKQSSLNFVIGSTMAKEYSMYFRKEFFPIMNSVPIANYEYYVENEVKIFSYFGGLHLNRWKMLIKLAKAIEGGVLNVYSIESPSKEILRQFENENINFRGGVSGENLKKSILASDVLIHVESDDEYNRSLTKLSVSTKIPEYLMSGRLILGFGPVEVASMNILSENDIGIVLSSSLSPEIMKSELHKITTDYNLRLNIGKRGYEYAVHNFNNKKIAEMFKFKINNL